LRYVKSTNECENVYAKKGLEPKVHDLALSIYENETLNFKDIPLFRLLLDIILLISISSNVGNSSSLTVRLENESSIAQIPIFSRNLPKYVSLYK
jgi:hypothetical protein